MALRKRGKWYHVDITSKLLPGGRLRFSTRPATKEQAQRIHNEVENAILSRKFELVDSFTSADYIWAELEAEYREGRFHEVSAGTQRIYTYAFKWWQAFLADRGKLEIPVSMLTRADVRAFKKWLGGKKEIQPVTYNMYHRSLQAVWNWAKRELNAVRGNPWAEVEKFPVLDEYRRDATPEDLKKVLPLIPDPLYQDFVIFLFISGMRRGEALNLTWQDIDWKRRFLVIRAATAKGKHHRLIPLSDLHVEILTRRNHLETPFTYEPRRASQIFSRAVGKAGLKGLSLHSLRHGSSTQLFEADEHPLRVKKLLGHRDLETTMGYTHLTPGYTRSSVEILSKLGREILAEVRED